MDFLVVGAQKCSTSWLYNCLRDHPEMHLPPKKLEKVYLGGNLHNENDDSWYRDFVGGQGTGLIKGDVSVDYLIDPRSPEVVRETVGPVKIIASLRDPVDRAVSAYFWNLRQGHVQALDPSEGLYRAVKVWKERSPVTSYESENYHYNLVARGMYGEQLQRYLDVFGRELVYIVYYEDILKRPVDTLQSLYSALHVASDFEPSSLFRRPKQNSYLRPLLRVERATPNSALLGKVTDLANRILCHLGLGNEKPSLSPKVKNALQSLYEPSNERLKELVQELPRSNVVARENPTPPWIDTTS
jgi:hypothetical protein